MKTKLFLLFFTFFSFHSSLQAFGWNEIVGYFKGKEPPSPPSIRVLLVHDIDGVSLEVKGKYSIFDPFDKNANKSPRFVGKNRYMQALHGGLKWGENFPGVYQLTIQPDTKDTYIVINGQSYTGSIYIYDIGGTISIVNQVPIENYVRTMLTKVSDLTLDPETLSALAITARTNAYYQILNPKKEFWAVDAQKVGFHGNVTIPAAIEKAVLATQNMIMSKTGLYEGIATPFPCQFDTLAVGPVTKEVIVAKFSTEKANQMAQKGEHAAQILMQAFPGITIMLLAPRQ
jgi:stage II sporulation protein D